MIRWVWEEQHGSRPSSGGLASQHGQSTAYAGLKETFIRGHSTAGAAGAAEFLNSDTSILGKYLCRSRSQGCLHTTVRMALCS